MRLLGLDYGTKTVGVAATDELGLMAHGVETIFRERKTKLRKTLSRIYELCIELNITQIVLGLPENFDGSLGERVQETLEFKTLLEMKTNLPVIMWDERCTTIEADEILAESNIPPQERKKYIDKIAATIILEDYINNHK